MTEDQDEVIISKVASAVKAAMNAKENLNYALTEAIDSASTFGYELGAEDMKMTILNAFRDNDSTCVDWALGVINEALSRS
jgi:hypothetical protein